MTWSLTQSKGTTTSGANLDTVFTSTPAQGSLMLAVVHDASSTTTPTVSDSNGNWTLLASKTRTTPNRGLYLFAQLAAASQPKTVNAVQGTDVMTTQLYEFQGAAKSLTGICETSNGTSGAGATSTSGSQPSITTTTGNQLVFTSIGWSAAITSPTLSDGTFTAGLTSPASITLADFYLPAAAVGTYNPSYSWTTSRNWLQLTASIKPAATGFFALL